MLSTTPWPADAVERRAINLLNPYANNPRTHSPEQITQIAASINEFGFTIPLLADEDGTLIAGHGRLMAAKQLGFATVPVMVARGWSEAQKNAYRIADNQLTLAGGWDDVLLPSELKRLAEDGFDLNLLGFRYDDLADLLADRTTGLTDEDNVILAPTNPASVVGDLWQLGRHRLLCGDATSGQDVARVLAGVLPHLMVTDPPYGVNYDPAWRFHTKGPDGRRLSRGKVSMGDVDNDDRCDWREAWNHFPGDVAYVWHGGLHAHTVAESLAAADFALRSQIIWAKQLAPIGRGDYHWQHEPCWYAVRKGKTGHYVGDRKQKTIWMINNHAGYQEKDDGATVHSTQKPVECMRRPINNNSSVGQAVYDPFVGSGTTIIAAEMTARSCLALELNPAYADVSVLRWQAFTGKSATDETGRPFAEIAAERKPQEAA